MRTFCIFNPEHDLCLANGDRNFVPPRSAMRFADNCHGIMRIVHDAPSSSVNTLRNFLKDNFSDIRVIPWGWNATLKHSLLRLGFPEETLPDDGFIAWVRKTQHRTSLLPLLNESIAVSQTEDLKDYLDEHNDIVLKSPWSGSGRGIRRICGTLGEKDLAWAKKTIRKQCCVIAEPFRDITLEFALEYDDGKFAGYSLFSSKNGVYRSNTLLYDDEIEELVNRHGSGLDLLKPSVEKWLHANVFPHYDGPLGIDCHVDRDNKLHVSEMNLRHTMGLVAHAYLQRHPETHGKEFSADRWNGERVV